MVNEGGLSKIFEYDMPPQPTAEEQEEMLAEAQEEETVSAQQADGETKQAMSGNGKMWMMWNMRQMDGSAAADPTRHLHAAHPDAVKSRGASQ